MSLQPPQLPYLGVYGVQQSACRDSRTGYVEWTVASSMFNLFIIYLSSKSSIIMEELGKDGRPQRGQELHRKTNRVN